MIDSNDWSFSNDLNKMAKKKNKIQFEWNIKNKIYVFKMLKSSECLCRF